MDESEIAAKYEGKGSPDAQKAAAVSLIEQDGRLLCVWNRRYEGWSLPGGMVEPGESPRQAQERELREETGLATLEQTLVFKGPHGVATPASVSSKPGGRVSSKPGGREHPRGPTGPSEHPRGPTGPSEGRASSVYVFRVRAEGQARMMEDGCPVTWKTREQFLACRPFASFYKQVFEIVPEGSQVLECGHTQQEHEQLTIVPEK